MIGLRDPSGAVIDGAYRYLLWRRTAETLQPRGTILFVMLNPSTADATKDDATIRRCLGFARGWGFDRLAVVNLFALRATNPIRLKEHLEPEGVRNDEFIEDQAKTAEVVVAAWGASPWEFVRNRATRVLGILERICDVWCLERTKHGDPRHPLYARKDSELLVYRRRQA